MKIVVFHPPMYPVNHLFYNMLGELAEVILYSFGEYPLLHKSWNVHEMKKSATNYKIKLFGSGSESFKNQMNPLVFKELIIDKPDFVISMAFWIPSLYGSLLKKMFGFKFLITTDAIVETEKNISSTRKRLREKICKHTDMFISASSLSTKYLNTLCSSIKITESLQTIDTLEWKKDFDSLSQKDKLKEELGLPIDKTILFGVGGFIPKKNWESMLEQIKELDDCIFVLVGAGVLEDKYHDMIKTLGLEEKVKMVTRKEGNELKKYFKASDIFIFPSFYDQFGYVVLEALVSELPVICSKNSGASSIVEDGKNGFIIDPDKPYINEIRMIIDDLDRFKKDAFLTMQKHTLQNKAKEWFMVLKGLENEA